MMEDFTLFVNWAVSSFRALYTAIGSWGIIGAFILAMPIFKRLIRLLKTVFSS